MKRKLLIIILCAIVAIMSFSISFSQNVKEIKLNRSNTFPKDIIAKQGAYNPLEAQLLIASKQPVSSKGLKFSIKLVNHSQRAITVKNVLEGATLIVYPNDSEALKTPPDASSRYFRKGQKWVLRDIPFEIGDVYRNGEKQNIDLKQTEQVTIPEGGNYVINLSVVKLEYYYKRNLIKETIKKGSYRFALSVLLTSWADTSAVFYDRVEVKPPWMIVEYGL